MLRVWGYFPDAKDEERPVEFKGVVIHQTQGAMKLRLDDGTIRSVFDKWVIGSSWEEVGE